MDYNEMFRKVLEIFPHAQMGEEIIEDFIPQEDR